MKTYREITKFGLLPGAILSLAVLASASIKTNEDQYSYTYLGQLSQMGVPYSGTADVTFTLWDAQQSGSTVSTTQRMNSITIKDGMFKMPLSFGDEAFGKKAKRWLEVTVRAPSGKGSFTTLTPRREVERNGSLNSGNNNRFDNRNEDIQLLAPDRFISAPNSIYLNIDSDNDSTTAVLEIAKDRTGDTGGTSLLKVQEDGNVGIGTTTPIARLQVERQDGRALIVKSLNHTGITVETAGVATWGVRATSTHASGHGLFGEVVVGPSGTGVGVLGTSVADQGIGVEGRATNDIGFGHGVKGTAFSSTGHGVHGENLEGGYAGYFVGDGYFSQKLLVGRENTVTGAEYFGIHAPVGNSTYGGMYISTDSETSWPFYGYAAGGTGDMWTYYDGGTGKWHLNNNGNRLTVTNEGYVGIGTTTPSYPLDLVTVGIRGISATNGGTNSGTAAVFAEASATSGSTYGVYGFNRSTGGTGVIGVAFNTNGINYGVFGGSNSSSGYDFYAAGAGVDYGSSSSRRWKNNIQNIGYPLDKVARLRGVYFDWDDEHGGHHDVGMIAEEVGEVLPEIVQYEKNGIDAIGMDYSKMTPLLVEALNALRAEKNSELDKLRTQNALLESRLVQLEVMMAQLMNAQKTEEYIQ